MALQSVPTVDYHDFISGDSQKREQFIQDLGDAFSQIGFVIVRNHGVSEELRQELFDLSKNIFAQPQEVKQKYEDLDNGGQRGYISKGRETAKGKKVPDLKEFWHIGQQVQDEPALSEEYPDNIWMEEVPDLQEVGTKVYRTFEQTGRNLLRAIALYLDLEEHYFDNKIHNGNSVLRLLHYFPVENLDEVEDGAVRAAAHGDINLITLLMGGSAKGLQAKNSDDEWVDVSPEANEIVINIGDMLHRHTNGRLKSTIHRVINLDKESMRFPRYSAPFFLHPRGDMDLSCLDNCITEEHPKAYNDITAGEFLEERIKELGLKK
ncbi:MAG: isopenicillin N synthase family dioxygenase [Aureispira sp.]